MKQPFIILRGIKESRRIYKKLFCYSILDTKQKEEKARLVAFYMIKDGKKLEIGAPIMLDKKTTIEGTIEELKKLYDLEDIYIDNDGATIVGAGAISTIDIYFEKF